MRRSFYIKFKLLIAAVPLFIICVSAQSNYHFKNFPDVERLSNNQVSDFFQDSYGFMWIATGDGLNRYDGRSVKIYKNVQGDAESLPDNATMQVIEDQDKNIWVACYNAIGKLDRKTDKFKKYNLDNLSFKSPPTFYSTMLDNQGKVWFSTSELGLIRFDESSDQFENIELSELNEKKMWGEVHVVSQLRNGLILAADATDGLKAYNTTTHKFDPFYLKPNYNPKTIYNIYEGSAGSVWFCGGSGNLIKYSPTQYSVKEINLMQNSKINSPYSINNGIVEDIQGNLWVGIYTHGLFKIDKQLTRIDQYISNPGNLHSLIDNKVSGIYQDKYGIIWLTFIDGGISQMDPNSNPFELYEINLPKKNNNQTIVRSITPSPVSESELIIGTNSDGILSYDLKLNRAANLDIKDASIRKDSNNYVNDLAVDYLGNIWYSINNSRLKKYNVVSKKIEIIESPHHNKTAQPFRIVSIDVSPDNKLWISSNYGVDRYDPITKEFFSVPRIMNKRMSRELRNSIDKIRNSRKPLSSILDVGEGQNLEEQLVLEKKSNVILIAVGEGRAIGGMFDRGRISDSNGGPIWEMSDIYETFYDGGGFKNRIGIKSLNLEKGDYQLSYYSDIGHSYKNWNTLSPDDSSYWGIEAYEVNDVEFKSLNELLQRDWQNKNSLPFEIGRLVEFSKTNSNTIWIGSSTNSFFKYDLTSNEYTQYNFDKNNLSDASHYIYCFYEDLDGILWVGTYSSFVRLDPRSGELHSFSTEHGLPGGNIYSITEDNNGALWIYSSGGLSKLNKNAPIDKYSFVNYDLQDGLEGLTQSSAVWKNEQGRIFLGGRGGIISFIPGSINTIEPDIVIYDFKIDDVSVFDDSTSFSLDAGIFDVDKIELSHDQNDIAFEFTAIHFSRPGKNKISYQLEGFSNKWYESDRNFASFTNLDPGEYTFRVKGSNGDGVWNESGKSIAVVVSPPWWQTTFAYISYGAFFILAMFSVDRFQRRRLLAKARERARIKESEMRAQIAEAENERKTKELEEARDLQLSMLPKDLPNLPNLDIAVYMQTATEVGGDYYDFHVGMDGTLTVVIGDATGHGMKAGTMVTTTKSLFNILAPNPDILTTFSEISRVIKGMKFHQLSMCLMLLKIKGDQLFISSAGMPPALIYRKKNRAIEEIFMKGMPLGSINNFPYSIKESRLEKGDTILMVSDGLPELTNDNKEMYGYDRTKTEFHSVGEKEPEEIVDHLKNSASKWANGKEPDDDITFVVIKTK
jgi:serine phosphatase RsbU (regulator of sigma subunit)/ligand-binding sensor domain-containing protein